MKTLVALLALSLITPNIFADNDRRPVGKQVKLHDAVSKKLRKKRGMNTNDKVKVWLEGKTFTGTAMVKPSKKTKSKEYNVYSILGSYAEGLMTDEAKKTYDKHGPGEYLIRVTYKKVNDKLYGEIEKMWPVKK